MTDGGLDTLPPALAAGNEQAYATLYDILGERLLRVAGAITGCRQDARDLVQGLLPELSREQARRHSMVLTGARLSPLP